MRQKSLWLSSAIFSNCALYINRGCCFSLDILDLVVSKRLSLVIRDPKMIPTLTVALFLSLFWPQIQSFPQGRFGLPYSDGENANSASRLFTVKRNKILFPRVGDEETNMAFRDEVQGRFGPRYRDGEANAGKTVRGGRRRLRQRKHLPRKSWSWWKFGRLCKKLRWNGEDTKKQGVSAWWRTMLSDDMLSQVTNFCHAKVDAMKERHAKNNINWIVRISVTILLLLYYTLLIFRIDACDSFIILVII